MCMLVLQVIVPLKIGSSLYLVLSAFDIARSSLCLVSFNPYSAELCIRKMIMKLLKTFTFSALETGTHNKSCNPKEGKLMRE